MSDHAAIFDGVVSAALRDCGPCDHGGALVRDHLPPRLSPAARAALLARLNVGETRYGQPLRLGWKPAPVELGQELLDAIAYAIAAGYVGPDMDALTILANRAVAGTFGRHL